MTIGPSEFASRARREAQRYGADAWVFVRELVQNARDAGATRVEWQVGREAGVERVVCRDDGGGMSLDHARRFLFTLYASSKRGSVVDAGRFGVGFWSVLRFDPVTVIVRSRAVDGDGWQATLGDDLRRLDVEPWETGVPGTVVELRRGVTGDDLRGRLIEAVRRDLGFVRRRGRSDERVEVLVDGEPVLREPALPPPSMEFRRPGLRGVVGLGDTPRVDLYAHGLRVRTAATLDELEEGAGDRARTPVSTCTPGLAPSIVIDADGLELLAARGDARADRALRRAVRTARRELDRLVADQLDAMAPLALGPRAAAAARRVGAAATRRRGWVAAAGGLLAAAAVVAAVGARLGAGGDGTPVAPSSSRDRVDVLDLHRGYRTPGVGFPGVEATFDLTYAPADLEPWITVLRRVAPDVGEAPDLRPDDGPPCREGCLELRTAVTGGGLARVPEPTGWRLDPAAVRLDGRRLELWRGATGEAVVELPPDTAGHLEVRAGRAAGPDVRRAGAWPRLPAEAQRAADAVAGEPFDVVVDQLESWVASRIRYDRSPTTAARHRALESAGLGLFDRIVEVGAGDCDVQNALLTALLERAGVRARMAVGLLGSGGRAVPALHAWVEARGPDDRWHVVDASTPMAGPVAVPPGPRPHRTEVAPAAPPRRVRVGVWLVVALATASAVAAVVSMRRARTVRRLAHDPALAPELLVRAALERPQALGSRAALDRRPLVPTMTGRRLSVARCRELARRRRLAACGNVDRWQAAVGRDGPATVDLRDPAAREVAAALRIPVVDDWAAVLDLVASSPLTRRVERALRAEGVRWSVRTAAGAPERSVAVVGWRRPEGAGSRLVVVRPPGARPAAPADALDVVREVGSAIGLGDDVARRVLARVARGLLREEEP